MLAVRGSLFLPRLPVWYCWAGKHALLKSRRAASSFSFSSSFSSSPPSPRLFSPLGSLRLYSSASAMADLSVALIAPNGQQYTQPTGLFINNEFVKGNGGTIVSVDPA
jgi:hypothetical protein